MKHIVKIYICLFLLKYAVFLANSHLRILYFKKWCTEALQRTSSARNLYKNGSKSLIFHQRCNNTKNLHIYIWFTKTNGLGFTGINIEVGGTADINFYGIEYKHFESVYINGTLSSWQKLFSVNNTLLLELSTKCEIMSRKEKKQMPNIIHFPTLFSIRHILSHTLYTADTLIWRYIAISY